MVDKSFHICSQKRDKRTDLTIQHVGSHAFKLNSSLDHPFVGVWQQFICYLVQALKTCQPFPATLKGWQAESFASNLSVLTSTSSKMGAMCCPQKGHRNVQGIAFLASVFEGVGFLKKMTQQSMMLLWFPTYLAVAFVYLVISRNLWVYQGPMTCHI